MKAIMILGTGSHVGKTTIVAALCRIFADKGFRTAPFKSQNMSLNSYATVCGREIARSTAVQAIAARENPSVHMNPILLKPISDTVSQVIIHGKRASEISAIDYYSSPKWHKKKRQAICRSIDHLKATFDVVIAEGAGSCAEPNFRDDDLVNMGVAHFLGADVYLVADIDRGGAFAEILGTMQILDLIAPEDRPLIKGIIINRFRGDLSLLQPAIKFITNQTRIPVAGVIPYLPQLAVEEEDCLSDNFCLNPEIDIAVIYLPHIANSSDFNPLAAEPGVRIRFVRTPETLGAPDLIIIPGSKNTMWDLSYLRKVGWEAALKQAVPHTPILGICGGFEMMGNHLSDPFQMESSIKQQSGFGFFDFTVHFQKSKKVAQVRYRLSPAAQFCHQDSIEGYEIHCGLVRYGPSCKPLFLSDFGSDGAFDSKRMLFGTFIHDLFRNASLTREVVNRLRSRKNLPPISAPLISVAALYESQYQRLAETVHAALFSNGCFEF